MSRSGTTPDEATQSAARALALFIGLGLPLALIGQWIFVPQTTAEISIPLTLITGLVAVAAARTVSVGGPRRVLLAPVIGLLDISAIVCGALLPVGLDITVILP